MSRFSRYAERRALRGLLEPGEEVLASDLVSFAEPSFVTTPGRTVLLVSTERIFVRHRSGAITVIDFAYLRGVGRKQFFSGEQPQLILTDGRVLTLDYHRRSRSAATANEVTRRFFGRVIADTTQTMQGEP
jgi:hypothetical protein